MFRTEVAATILLRRGDPNVGSALDRFGATFGAAHRTLLHWVRIVTERVEDARIAGVDSALSTTVYVLEGLPGEPLRRNQART